ncbi:unnamed protein product [Prorocentrum cordatum]|uniref:Uncharacterized protein n=1 Tax=Prorocentrum cordatum TaxID=2364126 RepID=A0ABN9T4T9_9DINO|nr:unnamed protein product [Polarella glacialis]
MTRPRSRCMGALRAFRRRGLYANLWGDFMVPFGTAAIEPAWGAGLADEGRARGFAERGGAEPVAEAMQRRRDGVAVRLRAARPVAPASPQPAGAEEQEEVSMARELEACGWDKFAVAFSETGSLFPMAHNKIAALSREGWRQILFSWLERTWQGEELMDDIASYVLGDGEPSPRDETRPKRSAPPRSGP